MKKILIFCIALSFTKVMVAQDPVSESLKKHYFGLYEQALKLNDLSLAIISLNNVLVELPEGAERQKYKDTLSILYFNNQAYFASHKLAEEVYKADASNYGALGRMGECLQIDLDFNAAIEAYAKVAPALKNPFYYYQMAICQYSLGRKAEVAVNVERVIADTSSKKYRVSFNMPNGYNQQVPLNAAALNLKAVLLMDDLKYANAKLLLDESLKLYPDFNGAQQNLLTCEDKIKEAKTKPKPKG